ncbi:hypothetical protein B0I72DRAFT_139326 [Yarrowia lipolytica]|jgi:hypothetical protein|nr:Hypothetical protein YALI2_D00176g [Yarrowia lipolytica]RDW31704.1 hypothetical protein B0I72DRAFT_139326 [Yarrowia lipolytica]RDW44158.1 hypothetical protein B0I74DRAFT_140889 [Yarrowia lipolytica]RDW55219.1 hypothetical protein B0I75DRAFT_133540 [Yarrowia lipolytica]SEI36870.1 YALIA101S14e02542g1_1 [Yarrowia lipolytica]
MAHIRFAVLLRVLLLLSLCSLCHAQFNLKATTEDRGVGNKTICMSGGKGVLLFPPGNSCVFTFRGGILTSYSTHGILFNEGEQLAESDNFRGSQILFKNSVLDPPNDWQFTACPESDNGWSVWMDANCDGGVTFEAILTPLDDDALRALEESASETTEANESTKSSTDEQPSESTSEATSEATSDSTTSDANASSVSKSASTKTVTEIVTITGEDSSQVSEVTTTRTITQDLPTPGVVTVTHHVTSYVVGGGNAASNVTPGAQNATPDVPKGSPLSAASPADPTSDPGSESPAWNVGALPSGENGVHRTPDSGTQEGAQSGAPEHTIWWSQPSSPWWTQQTGPWWTPESLSHTASNTASSGTSTPSASVTAQENGSERTLSPLKPVLETILALLTVHITFFYIY